LVERDIDTLAGGWQ